jgi:hypothetical protein
MTTNANSGIMTLITAKGHLSNAVNGIYSVAVGIRNSTGGKKHNNVPRMTTNKR